MNPDDFLNGDPIFTDSVVAEADSAPTSPPEVLAEPEPVYIPAGAGFRDSPGLYLGPPTSVSVEQSAVVGGGALLTPDSLTSLYLATFGRPPDANEMASDLDNARRYGDAGVVRGIQLRAGNVAGSGVRGDEYLPSLQAQQDAVVMNYANGLDSPTSALNTGSLGTEGFRDILGGIVGMLPFPGAPAVGGIISGFPSLAPPRLPMPAPPQGRLPAPRTPPIIDIPMPRGGGMTRGARAAAIAAAAAAAGLSVQQYLMMHPELRRRRHLNVLNPRALRRAFTRIDGFGRFVKRTIHLEQHAPRPKHKRSPFPPRRRK